LNTVVCIKRVPDTEARIRIDADGTSIDPAGVKFVMSPFDEFALETALRIREARGGGEVVVLTVGDPAAAEQLRAGLAMGADRAILLRGPWTMDGLATARAIAAAVRDANADLVLTGMKAVDDDQQQVGPMLAELLDLPCVTVVSQLEVADGVLVAHREIEGGIQIVEAALPAVVTITKGEFEPRYPSLKGIMAAKRKPLEEKDAEPGPARVTVRQLALPPERPPGRIIGQGADAVPELVRLLRQEAGVL
jgi:electron transfer flavoprotein beta subunit